VGGAVKVICAAFPGEEFVGTVISIAPQANAATRQFPVRVKLSDTRLKAGMAVTGRIFSTAPEPTLMISADATLQGKLGPMVWRVVPPAPEAAGDAGAAGAPVGAPGGMPPLPGVESVAVETGDMAGGWVVVLKGDLKAGDLLVTRGKENLYPGAKVMVGQPPQAPPDGTSGAGGASGTAPGAKPDAGGKGGAAK
jgi:multidrug efflux pump subunit AcrA (membrane-fusion protein)